MATTVRLTAAWRVLYFLLTSLFIAGCLFADTGVQAPQFTARTLDGQTVSSSSFSGNVVLLQFWTTWCPVCHQDQAAVDNIQAALGGSGLVVLAVNDGEPDAVVKKYLQAYPRSCEVLLSNGHAVASLFGVHSYPHYVVIDRRGNIVANKGGGGGGEAYLRYLLRSAGLGAKTGTVDANNRTAAAPTGGPQWMNVPFAQNTVTAKPIPKTVFVFTSGEQLEADHYVLHSTFLRVTAGGQDLSIPISALDVKKTIAVNHEHGISLKIPTNGSEVFLGF